VPGNTLNVSVAGSRFWDNKNTDSLQNIETEEISHQSFRSDADFRRMPFIYTIVESNTATADEAKAFGAVFGGGAASAL
jgi:hypothetical protein